MIFNCSFSTGLVPDRFKVARVNPNYKSGSKICINNYRSISLLSVFNKIIEKLMYKRIIKFIDKNNILNQN
jgi:hypothetical protein